MAAICGAQSRHADRGLRAGDLPHPFEQPKDVASLDLTWDTLRGDALPRAASLALLEEAAKSWTSAM